jgi:hypothetical protein
MIRNPEPTARASLLEVFAALALVGLSCAARPSLGEAPARGEDEGRRKGEAPALVEARGRLVCLAEEMRERYQVEIPPVHEHLLGFRLEGEAPAGALRYYTLLRTAISEGLFADKRFQERTLVLRGRRFPESALLEVNRYGWIRDGKLHDVYYWCDICSIRGTDPGRCACCQGEVELREAPRSEP